MIMQVVVGCSGITSYEPRNTREEGPEKGIFTGSEGEFIIYRKVDDQETGSTTDKNTDETTGQP